MLCLSCFLDKGTVSTIHHENKRRRPRLHITVRIPFSGGKSLGVVDSPLAKIRSRIIHGLLNRSAVRRDTKQGIPMIVSIILVKTVRDLSVQEQ